MVRPSRNIDQLLLQAGHELLPETGVRGLSIRQVAEHAGVNPGMFHYHFKTKDVFVRALLEDRYNAMFSNLELAAHRFPSALENLRAATNILGRFARDNRVLLVRLLNDAFAGERVVMEFLRANLPRHLGVLTSLIAQAQKEGVLKPVAPPQALTFLMGGVGAAILLGTAVLNSGMAPPLLAPLMEQLIFSDAAIAERVDMALVGLAVSTSAVPLSTGVSK